MTLLERLAKAEADRNAPRCILCGLTAKAHGTAHTFRVGHPVRFTVKDLTWQR